MTIEEFAELCRELGADWQVERHDNLGFWVVVFDDHATFSGCGESHSFTSAALDAVSEYKTKSVMRSWMGTAPAYDFSGMNVDELAQLLIECVTNEAKDKSDVEFIGALREEIKRRKI